MTSDIGRFRRFFRHADPFTWATYVAGSALVAILLFGVLLFLPKASAESIRAGLTLIGEILGVVLGAVLVIAVLLIEQSWQAEALLRGALPEYRELIELKIDIVNDAREQLVEQTRQGTIELNQPVFVGPSGLASSTKFRDAIRATSTLTYLFSTGLRAERIEKDLEALGYSEDEIAGILYLPAVEELCQWE